MASSLRSEDSTSVWSTATDASLPARRSSRARKQQHRVIHVEGIPDSVPAFLRKTYYILDSEKFSDCISWAPDGQTISISKLNMYGFHKTTPDPACREFRHEFFLRGRPDLVTKIKRKVTGVHRAKAPPQSHGADDTPRNGPTRHASPAHLEAAMPVSVTSQPPVQRSGPRQGVALSNSGPEQHPHATPPPSGSWGGPPASETLAPGSFESFVSSTAASQSRRDMDSMLEEIVKLRAAQQRLQVQISSMKQRAHAADGAMAAIEREAAHSTSRQSATQRRLERLMMFTYELYKSLWLVHQRAQITPSGSGDAASVQGTGHSLLAGGSSEEAARAGEAVQQIFFSAHGLVSPEQFVRMLDYVDVDTPAFAAMHRDPSAVLRLRDGPVNDCLSISGSVPPTLGAPVPAAGAFGHAASLAKDLASGLPPNPKQRRLDVGKGSTAQQQHTVQQVESLGNNRAGATAAPLDIFSSPAPAVSPPAAMSSNALEINSLNSGLLLGNLSPFADSLANPSPTQPDSIPGFPAPVVAQTSDPILTNSTGHHAASFSPLATDSLEDADEASRRVSADNFAAELSSLVNVQDELTSAEHTLLGNLARADMQLASDFPDEHAAFTLHANDTNSSDSQGGSDPAGLRLVDLDLE